MLRTEPGRNKKRTEHRRARGVLCVAILLAAGLGATYFGGAALGNMALVSAGVLMPEGGAGLLQDELDKAKGGADGYQPTDPAQAETPPPQTTEPVTQAPPNDGNLAYTPADIKALMEAERAKIEAMKTDGKVSAQTYTKNNATHVLGDVWAQNKTYEHALDLKKVLAEPVDLKITDKKKPHILIYHTHTTESYMLLDNGKYSNAYTTRSNDPKRNMIRVGDEICAQLEKAGFAVIHDTSIYDATYSGAYYRSEDQVAKYLKQYPEIQVTLDIHRDAIKQSNGTMVKPTATINGKKAAQIMIITGCQEKDITGYPDWEYNLRFATQLQKQCQEMYPGLVRPLFFCARVYNMHMTRCSLLIEMGSDSNTLDEAAYSGRLLGSALATMLERYVIKELSN